MEPVERDPFPLEVFHRLHAGLPLVGTQMRTFPTRLFGPAPFFKRFLSKWRYNAPHRDAVHRLILVYFGIAMHPLYAAFLYTPSQVYKSYHKKILRHLSLQFCNSGKQKYFIKTIGNNDSIKIFN